ncbi:MAG: exodeoxyribonuclease VII small subunit [Phycisphaerae bacterium]
MTKQKTEDKMTFEKAMERLEAIVSAIEAGEVPLEESIENYAEGIELVKQCRTILDRAEKKIQLLGKGDGDSLTVIGELDADAAVQADEEES